MSTFKYQEAFATELTEAWLAGKHEQVRLTIRGLKNKAQAAYIAAKLTVNLVEGTRDDAGNHLADDFVNFIHPNL